MLEQTKTSQTNRNDAAHRKELNDLLSDYLDHRHVRSRGQTYIYPDLIYQLIRSLVFQMIFEHIKRLKLSRPKNSSMYPKKINIMFNGKIFARKFVKSFLFCCYLQ